MVYLHYIYTLRCPDTNAVRYVGCTQHPKERRRAHCFHAINQPRTRVQEWLKFLREQDKCPLFEVIEQGYGSWLHEAEWIKIFKAQGYDLLNVRFNN